MPLEENKHLKFINFHKKLKAPFHIYADFESIIEPLQTVENDRENKSFTDEHQQHIPSGFAYKVVSIDDRYTKKTVFDRGEDCIENSLNVWLASRK